MSDEQNLPEVNLEKELSLEDLESVAGGAMDGGSETDLIESADGTRAYNVKTTDTQLDA